MGNISKPEPAMLFIGMLYADPAVCHHIQPVLEKEFGDAALVSREMKWQHSEYYRDELGWPLLRQFVFYKKFIDQGDLAAIKIRTNELENIHSEDNKRRINLDPGYLTLSKLVLASTKNYAHRLYLGQGIYGEITLYFQKGAYRPHLFTYRDYREKNCIDLFMHARAVFRDLLSEKASSFLT